MKQSPVATMYRCSGASCSTLEDLVAHDVTAFASLMPPGNDQRIVFPGFISGLCIFLSLLRDENAHVNLTADADPRVLLEHHVHDSLAPLILGIAQPHRLLDIGSGGGFPAVLLALAWPETTVALVESVRKKARFLQLIVDQVPLPRTTVAAQRVETLGAPSRNSFDMVTARGVASIETLYGYALPLLAPGGRLVMWKGENDLAALQAPGFCRHLRETHATSSVLEYRIPGIERRSKLVILQVAQ